MCIAQTPYQGVLHTLSIDLFEDKQRGIVSIFPELVLVVFWLLKGYARARATVMARCCLGPLLTEERILSH